MKKKIDLTIPTGEAFDKAIKEMRAYAEKAVEQLKEKRRSDRNK